MQHTETEISRRLRSYAVSLIGIGALTAFLGGQVFAQGTTSAQVYEGATTNSCQRGSVPNAARSAGFTDLAFCDDFNSMSTIDVTGSGAPGFKWYTNQPFGGGQTQPSEYSVSHSVLSVASNTYTGNWTLTTRDPKTGNGGAWNFGFFEARVRFDPTLGPKSPGWPSFWSLSSYHTQFNNLGYWPELDFFEAYTGGFSSYSGAFVGTLHQWKAPGGNYENWQNSNNFQNTSVDWNDWHILGCLWTPGQVTWYLDGNALMTQKYSATAPPNPSPDSIQPPPYTGVFDGTDTQTMQLILGSGPKWPLYVDWVKVWQPDHDHGPDGGH